MSIESLFNVTVPAAVFSTQKTPSAVDGIDATTEEQFRILGCKLIRESRSLLKIPQVAISTAQVLFQRFFFQRSFKIFSVLDIAMVCVFLACKLEECPRRQRDIINIFDYLHKLYRNRSTTPLPYVCEEYFAYKEALHDAEIVLLTELGFAVGVHHAHGLLLNYLKALDLAADEGAVCQDAISYLNDASSTSVFVRFQPQTIACACVHMALEDAHHAILRLEHCPWWEIFDASLLEMRIIAEELRRFYAVKIDAQLPVSHDELEAFYPLDYGLPASVADEAPVAQSQRVCRPTRHSRSPPPSHRRSPVWRRHSPARKRRHASPRGDSRRPRHSDYSEYRRNDERRRNKRR